MVMLVHDRIGRYESGGRVIKSTACYLPDVRSAAGNRLIRQKSHRARTFRRIAMRFEKIGSNFLTMARLASIRLWLRANEFMA